MEIALNVDLSDPPRYSVVPCDEDWVDSIFEKCAKYGVQRLLWRVSLGRAYYHSKLMTPVDRACGERWIPVAKVVERMDPLECAVRSAKRHGVKILAWYPFSETHISKTGLNLTDPFFSKRRDLYWLNRDASRCFLGHPCLAEPEAAERLTAICKELSDYGVDGIFLSTRTHCPRPGLSSRNCEPFKADEFGFNDPVVKEMKARTGVDISITPVEEMAPEVITIWHRLKGEALTNWLRDVRAMLRPRGQELFLNITPDRYGFLHGGTAVDCLRIYKDWETWIGEDIVDGISVITLRDLSPEPNVVSIDPIRNTVPDGPLYIWTINLYTRPLEEGTGRGLDFGNWRVRTPEVVDKILEKVAAQGARGAFMHEMYALFFTDSGGKDIGIGAVPQDEYWPVIAKWADKL